MCKTEDLAHLLGKIETSEHIEQEGDDVYLLLYDDACEWTYWDGEKAVKGRHCSSCDDLSKAVQLQDMKVKLVQMFGTKMYQARLHVANHRYDRHDW
jgi:hypothetical protein